MLLFLDTEYTDFQAPSLISIGLVSEDGTFEFYGERTDFDYDACGTFVRSNVWAHLGLFPEKKFKQVGLEESLAAALGAIREPVSFAFDSDRDLQLLMGMFQRWPGPPIVETVDLRELQSTGEYQQAETAFFNRDRPQHHALFDAMANRAAWLACGGRMGISNRVESEVAR